MSPDVDVEWYSKIYFQHRNRLPLRLREDFCGTFKVSCEWIKQSAKHTAISMDLDPEPLAYGHARHFVRLTPSQQKRLKVLQQNVLTPPSTLSDVISAANFSFFIFKQRKDLKRYFKSCLKSLHKDGMLLLEMVGGPEMLKVVQEKTRYRGFTYIWDQKSFDPVTHDALYAIHFKIKDGPLLKDAFVYDWRLWTIPEIQDLLREAGFKRVTTYWDRKGNGKGSGEYIPVTQGRNHGSWISYLAAFKND